MSNFMHVGTLLNTSNYVERTGLRLPIIASAADGSWETLKHFGLNHESLLEHDKVPSIDECDRKGSINQAGHHRCYIARLMSRRGIT